MRTEVWWHHHHHPTKRKLIHKQEDRAHNMVGCEHASSSAELQGYSSQLLPSMQWYRCDSQWKQEVVTSVNQPEGAAAAGSPEQNLGPLCILSWPGFLVSAFFFQHVDSKAALIWPASSATPTYMTQYACTLFCWQRRRSTSRIASGMNLILIVWKPHASLQLNLFFSALSFLIQEPCFASETSLAHNVASGYLCISATTSFLLTTTVSLLPVGHAIHSSISITI